MFCGTTGFSWVPSDLRAAYLHISIVDAVVPTDELLVFTRGLS